MLGRSTRQPRANGDRTYRVRTDLKVEQRADGSISVSDPETDRSYTFSETEAFLFSEARQRKRVDEARAAYSDRYGEELSQQEVVAFYRRLGILGLLDTGPDQGGTSTVEPAASHDLASQDGPSERLDDPQAGWDESAGRHLRLLPGREPGRFGGRIGAERGPGATRGLSDGDNDILDFSSSASGRERFLAAIARRRMAGGAGGFQRQEEPPQARSEPPRLNLFNPTFLLRVIYVLSLPARLLSWVLVPAILLAGLTVFQRWPDFALDIGRISQGYTVFTRFVIGALAVNLLARLCQGTALVGAGARVQSFGIKLVFGVLPLFFVDTSGARKLDRKGQLRAYAAPLLARLAAFAFGILGWAVLRSGGGLVPETMLLMAQFGLIMFLITAFPLIPAEGMKWLGAYYGEPNLVPKMVHVLRHKLKGEPLDARVGRSDIRPLFFFGTASLLVLGVAMIVAGAYAAIALESQLSGTGILIFITLVTASTLWIVSILNLGGGEARAKARDSQAQDAAGFDGFVSAAAMAGEEEQEDQHDRSPPLWGAARVFWAVVVLGLLAVAFLPYQYEAGGEVEVLPSERGHAIARNDGQIEEILVREGDAVTRGQVVARLSSWEQKAEVELNEILLEREKAQLARLKAGAKPEEIVLAQQRVASVEAEVAYEQSQADRARELFVSDTVSQQELDRAVAGLEETLARLEVARAELALVESDATEEEILVAEAEVRRLEQQLDFSQDELERTRVLAPTSGRIVTANPEFLLGSYLEKGDVLLEIEEQEYLTAQAAVPEGDISLISIGDTVRFKPYSLDGREVDGEVQSIAPNAEPREFGRIVRVVAVFPGQDGLMRPAMTGYAKIEGAEMKVWEAFLRRIVRFYQVDVWSWIP